MAKRIMLIDASHPEETRVVVHSGNRLEDFDYESASKKQLKGNIYLAKITRVEPSLQAAFVEYGGNRHGFLPFSEIHPDYYRIPIADRKALLAEEAALEVESADEEPLEETDQDTDVDEQEIEAEAPLEAGEDDAGGDQDEPGAQEEPEADDEAGDEADDETGDEAGDEAGDVEEVAVKSGVDTVGGDEVDDTVRRRARLLRKYKIQEVIKRRQVILVQVTKEERGNKGAALTTYLSLAGRYCVLMPNTGRSGGISRKISSPKDRRRLKRILEDIDIPDGISVIVRTAGSERTKAEIRRDYEYLMRLWDEIRNTTLASTAPSLIYEEANLIKRAIRDLYGSDMADVLVEGEEGYQAAKAFMKSLMPSHAKRIKWYKDPAIPLFYHYQVESQIDAMHTATVPLKSGGYIVINMTEALVAIDVNSGKATRARHIEETAHKTNLEASDEIARQLRLRDLAGLIVIDYIDMEESRHNRSVERRLKEAMRSDRARIQLGRISPFGLLEMSRQRLRPSLFESSTVVCPQCNASGYVRTTESVALHVLRGLEEEGIRRGGGEITVAAPREAALHILNQMRDRLVEIEQRYGFRVRVVADDSLIPPDYALDRLSQGAPAPHAPRAGADAARAEAAEGERGERKRGRGRRRRKKDEDQAATGAAEEEFEAAKEEADEGAVEGAVEGVVEGVVEAAEEAGEDMPKRRRRRGKRGGRRRSHRGRDEAAPAPDAIVEAAGPGEPESAGGVAEEGPPVEAADSEAADLEVADSEVANFEVANFEVADSEVADSEVADSEVADSEVADSEAVAAKPKRRRSRGTRKRKPAAAEAGAAEAGLATEAVAAEPDAAVEPAAEETDAAAEAKTKRRRRSAGTKQAPRRKRAEPEADPEAEAPAGTDAQAAAGTGAAPPLDEAAPAAGREPVADAPLLGTPPEAPSSNGEDSGDEPSEPAGSEPPDGPRRRGWWQRWG